MRAGETRCRDHVVRLYKRMPGWSSGLALRSELGVSHADPAFPRCPAAIVAKARQPRVSAAVRRP